MRVVTFNIQHGRSAAGRVDAALATRTCVERDADILGLQEVDVDLPRSGHSDIAAEIAAAAGMRLHFGAAVHMDAGRYGNALLVRGELDDIEDLVLPRAGAAEPRAAIVATAVVERQRISTAATHLSTRPELAVRQLHTVVTALRARPLPRLLLGDLNLPPDAVADLLEPLGMTLAGGGPTFPAHRPRLRIDHVAVEGLSIGAVATPRTPLSDHRPLQAELDYLANLEG